MSKVIKLNAIEALSLDSIFNIGGKTIFDTKAKFCSFLKTQANIDVNTNEYFWNNNELLSQAKILLKIWNEFSITTVIKVLDGLLEYDKEVSKKLTDEEIKKVTEILNKYKGIDNFSIDNINVDDAYKKVAEYIKNNVNSEPRLCVDRVHTLAHKIIVELCKKYDVDIYKKAGSQDKQAIGILFGHLMQRVTINFFQNTDEKYIIKSFESLFNQEFNNLRNQNSLAHANDIIIASKEAEYITKAIMNALKYLMDKL